MKLPNGQRINADSHYYYPSKGASREVAASNVLKAICPAPKSVCKSASLPPIVPHVPPSTTTRKLLIYKEKLNNELHGKQYALPKYNTFKIGEQLFQCTISHHLIGTITGLPGKSKRHAEDSAAKLALDRLKIK